METLFVGRNIIFLPEINSTNSYATDLLKNVNLAEGTVVHTACQTDGRGQRGTTWKAEPGSNITASIILKPVFLSMQKQFFLYKIMALATSDTLAEMLDSSQFDIKIKWPNDILVDGKKAAGILIENNLLNNRFNWSVIGVGMNVNQVEFEPGLRAVSPASLTGRRFDVKAVLENLCSHTEKYYLALKQNKWEWIQQLYLDRFFCLDTWREFELEGKPERLMVCGLGAGGLLLLQRENGSRIEADVKQIKWLY